MQVQIDVWSDYVCPFCYLEQPVLERIAQEFGVRVGIRWRAFELPPDPVPTLKPDSTYLRDIWARGVYPMAKERGMTLRLPPMQPEALWRMKLRSSQRRKRWTTAVIERASSPTRS
jgi:predicted DsbA family dithiol-disulfide isomerase